MVVRNAVGERTAVCFGFNGWGKKYKGWQKDVGVNVAVAQALKLPVVQSDLVLEGGAVEIGTSKGELVGIATEQCVRSDLPRALQTHFAAPSEFYRRACRTVSCPSQLLRTGTGPQPKSNVLVKGTSRSRAQSAIGACSSDLDPTRAQS